MAGALESKWIKAAPVVLPARLLSLDVFRGLAIAGMILVNNPGSWQHVYAPLRHAEWHGWTPTDLIFPSFLFIVGVALTLSFSGRLERGEGARRLWLKAVRRSAIIFALGLLLNGFPHFDLSTIRIPGVLQRIAVCYLLAATLFLVTGIRGQIAITFALLAGYWLLMTRVPVPGYGAGDLSPEGNLAAYIDRQLMAGHLWRPNWDPEGILSTLPALATTLCGVLAGRWLKTRASPARKAAGLAGAGLAGLLLGEIIDPWFPINKNLWTSSYVLFTAGAALILLALCYWTIEIKGFKRWAKPFEIYGVNAIAVYVLSGLMGRLLIVIDFTLADGSRVPLKAYLFQSLFARLADPINASLAFAICYVLFWLALMWALYRRRIFIKV